jgi:3-oxoadipate enol-lactonase
MRAAGRTVYFDLAGPGDAPVVAFGNSLGTSVHVWDDVVGTIGASLRTLRFDMRGHGLTDVGETPSMDDLARDAVGLFDALGIARVRFVGLSIGGMIAQRLAAAYPDRVEALVLCATASKIGAPATWNERIDAVGREGTRAVRDGVLARWFTPSTHETRPDLIRGFANMLERTPAAGYAGACAAIRDADLASDDARIACPTLAIAGADDAVTPPSDALALRDAIAGARVTVIAGAAHIVPAERPSEFLAAALPFLIDPHGAGA